jgi:hypothetical protein
MPPKSAPCAESNCFRDRAQQYRAATYLSSRAHARDLAYSRGSHKLTCVIQSVVARSLAVCVARDDGATLSDISIKQFFREVFPVWVQRAHKFILLLTPPALNLLFPRYRRYRVSELFVINEAIVINTVFVRSHAVSRLGMTRD